VVDGSPRPVTLTGCLNRSAVLAELERAVTAPDVDRLAVVFVDLDAFKSVNDTHGHAVGDELLTVAAARLAAQARPTDLVGRIGGDEFLLICPDVADRTQALRLAQRVHDHLRATVPVTGARLRLAASVGVTLARVGATADLLVAESDSAMYQAKRTGTGPVFFARA
jgi:diguanylate cyclase (GGDEF)-like protein